MKNIKQKHTPKIHEKFWGVNTAIAFIFIMILAGANMYKDGNLEGAEQASITAFYTLLGTCAYLLQKKRYFDKAPKYSKLLEFLFLTPLILHLLWYIIAHGHNWQDDPYPLTIVSVLWSLTAYTLLSHNKDKETYKEYEKNK